VTDRVDFLGCCRRIVPNPKQICYQCHEFRPAPADTPEQALEIANDTLYGLGSGVWTRDLNMAYRFGRGIKAERVWTNCYHAYRGRLDFGAMTYG
jgi:hypothetical protein